MRKTALPVLAMFSCSVFAHSPEPAASGCAQYLGNEGVLVSDGETSILFDAFYSNNYGQYALVPKRIQDALVNGDPPYENIDAVFVSHVHGDHFSPEPALRFLRAQPHVRLFGSRQTADALEKAGAQPDVMERVTIFDLAPSDKAVASTLGDIAINVIAIPHSGGVQMADIQNLSFRVTLNGDLSVLHLGDVGPVRTDFARHQDHWNQLPLEAAFPPYWLFRNETGRGLVEEFLKARHVVGVHVPASAAGRGAQMRLQTGYDLFTDPGEVRSLMDGSSGDCAMKPERAIAAPDERAERAPRPQQ